MTRLDLKTVEQILKSSKMNVDFNYLNELMKAVSCFDTDDVEQGTML